MTTNAGSAASEEAIRVAVAIDAGYAPWAATLIWSCLQANPREALQFDVLHDGSLSVSDRARLASIVDAGPSAVHFHDFERGRLRSLPSTPEFGTIVWLRFHLPEVLGDASRVLYLDSDTFVAGALRPLWETDLGVAPVAAVANVVEPGARAHVAELGVAYPGGFFNSGVLLLDLERMRSEHATEALLRFAEEHRADLLWPDQDALNAVFAERWVALHPRWNAQNSLWSWRDWSLEVFDQTTIDEATSAPKIRHFEGPGLSKPWHYLCPHQGRDEYRAALRRTPWAGLPLKDRTPATRLIRLLPVRAQLDTYKRLLAWRAAAGR